MTLAIILRTDPHVHRPVPKDIDLPRAIGALGRAAQDGIWQQVKAVQELRAGLRESCPGFWPAEPALLPRLVTVPLCIRPAERSG